jgi:hypothetical protein
MVVNHSSRGRACAHGASSVLRRAEKPKWRNGRRSGFKIRRPEGREGSSPSFGTSWCSRGAAGSPSCSRGAPLPSSSRCGNDRGFESLLRHDGAPRLVRGERRSPRAPQPQTAIRDGSSPLQRILLALATRHRMHEGLNSSSVSIEKSRARRRFQVRSPRSGGFSIARAPHGGPASRTLRSVSKA